jgi:DNA-binding transcriptional ArsR family regulator
MNRKNKELRTKVYSLLIEGGYQSKIARILKVPESTVRYHTRRLREEEAIIELGKGNPKFYGKGRRSDRYDQTCGRTVGGAVIDSAFLDDDPCCLHNIQFKASVLKLPKNDPIMWERTVTPQGVEMKYAKLRIHVDSLDRDVSVPIQLCSGKTVLFRPEKMVLLSSTYEQKKKAINAIAWASANAMGKLGYLLALPEQRGHVHFAFRERVLDNLPVEGRIDEHSWIDKSGTEDGKAHWETDSPMYLEQRLRLVPDVLSLKTKVGYLEDAFVEVEKGLEKVLRVVEELPLVVKEVVNQEFSYRPKKPKHDIGYG